jgi:hypothetical protein
MLRRFFNIWAHFLLRKKPGFAGTKPCGAWFCGRTRSVHGWTHYGSKRECVCECAPAGDPKQEAEGRRRRLRGRWPPAVAPLLQSLAHFDAPLAGVNVFQARSVGTGSHDNQPLTDSAMHGIMYSFVFRNLSVGRIAAPFIVVPEKSGAVFLQDIVLLPKKY